MPDIQLDFVNAAAKTLPDTVKEAEIRYHQQIDSVAETVLSRKVRIVLLAGPSASGKTTSANLIADAIRRRGHTALVVSLDDFYRSSDDPAYPRLPNGERDFERPEALDLPFLCRTLDAIADGEPFSLPKFDFKLAHRESLTPHEALTDGCVIVEGLHALNPTIVDALEGRKAVRLFVSLSTNLHDGETRVLSGKKLRFLRRLVRDNLFRASDAVRTLSLWQGVLAGEEKYLYPYRASADLYVNTFHLYEPGILKDLALPLLAGSPVEDDAYIAVILAALGKIDAVDPSVVPADSLLREFIGGGIYEHLY